MPLVDHYLPYAAVPIVISWINLYQCQLKIVPSRASKRGDYRPPYHQLGHRISINSNLNPYAFLLTIVHEFAHLLTWIEIPKQVKPHGEAWKNNFRKLMEPILEAAIFPDHVQSLIRSHLKNPRASSCTDLSLLRAIQAYNNSSDAFMTVEKLAPNSLFIMPNGRSFRKENRLSKRYRCVEIKTGMAYLFHPLADVKIMP